MRAYARERQPESIAECGEQQRRYLIASTQPMSKSATEWRSTRTSKYSLWSSLVRRSSSAHRAVMLAVSRIADGQERTTFTEDEDIIYACVVPDKQIETDEAGEDDRHSKDTVDE